MKPRVIEIDRAVLGVATIGPRFGSHNTVTLHHLKALPRGEGRGSKMLALFCAKADETGAFIELQARPEDGSRMSQDELIAWYTKRGFQSGRNFQEKGVYKAAMLRPPTRML